MMACCKPAQAHPPAVLQLEYVLQLQWQLLEGLQERSSCSWYCTAYHCCCSAPEASICQCPGFQHQTLPANQRPMHQHHRPAICWTQHIICAAAVPGHILEEAAVACAHCNTQ
jgi:hypothetical protein